MLGFGGREFGTRIFFGGVDVVGGVEDFVLRGENTQPDSPHSYRPAYQVLPVPICRV